MVFPLGAIFAGDPAGHYQQSQLRQAQVAEAIQQMQALQARGQILQQLGLPGATAMPGGGQPGSPMGQMGGGGMPPMGGGGNAMGGAPTGRMEELNQPPGGGAPPMGGGGGQPGGGAPGMGGGNLSLQSVIQQAQRILGPKADPATFARAIDGMIPLMNAQANQQWRQLREQIQMAGLGLQQERLQLGQERLTQQQAETERKTEGQKQRIELAQDRLKLARETFNFRMEQARATDKQKDEALRIRAQNGDVNALRALITAERQRALNIIGMMQQQGADEESINTIKNEIDKKIKEYEKQLEGMTGAGGSSSVNRRGKGSFGAPPAAPAAPGGEPPASFEGRFTGQ